MTTQTGKRDYGSGSLREVRPGVWELRYQGRTKRVRCGSKDAARALAAMVTAAKGRGPSAVGTTLGQLRDEWLTSARIADSTRTTYLAALAHLPAKLAGTRLDRLTLRDFDQTYAQLDRAGVGRHQIHKLHTALSAALTEGVRWGYLEHHPARGARLPELPHKQVQVPPADALERLRTASKADPLTWVWLRLVLATGARRSEVLALRWSAVDLPAGTMRVHQSLTKERTAKSTKTNRVRVVELDAGTVAELRTWRSTQRKQALATGAGLARDPFVISNALDGSIPWRPDGATQRFRRLCARAGVEGVRLQDLRHANASMMLDAGVPSPAAADRLGHSVATLHKVYAHVMPGANREAADKIGHALG